MSFTSLNLGAPGASPAAEKIVNHRDAGKNLPQGAARVRVLTRPINSVSLSFLQQGLGGMEYRFPAVVCGTVVFSEQSAGWENRPLSLERDFIDVMCPAPPPMPRSHRRDDAGKERLEVIRVYRKAFGRKFADAGSFKAESRVNHPLPDRKANTICQGPVAASEQGPHWKTISLRSSELPRVAGPSRKRQVCRGLRIVQRSDGAWTAGGGDRPDLRLMLLPPETAPPRDLDRNERLYWRLGDLAKLRRRRASLEMLRRACGGSPRGLWRR